MDVLGSPEALTAAFSIWAIVVGWGVAILRALRQDVRHVGIELHEYIKRTEARIAVLEYAVKNDKREGVKDG